MELRVQRPSRCRSGSQRPAPGPLGDHPPWPVALWGLLLRGTRASGGRSSVARGPLGPILCGTWPSGGRSSVAPRGLLLCGTWPSGAAPPWPVALWGLPETGGEQSLCTEETEPGRCSGPRTQQGVGAVGTASRPPLSADCLSHAAAHVLARRCYGRQRCRVPVDSLHFGSPCPPGARKYLTVAYACGKIAPRPAACPGEEARPARRCPGPRPPEPRPSDLRLLPRAHTWAAEFGPRPRKALSSGLAAGGGGAGVGRTDQRGVGVLGAPSSWALRRPGLRGGRARPRGWLPLGRPAFRPP